MADFYVLCCDDNYVVIGIFTIDNKLFVQHLHNIINRRQVNLYCILFVKEI